MVQHQKLSSSVASNNNLATIALQTFKCQHVLTNTSPALFSMVTAM